MRSPVQIRTRGRVLLAAAAVAAAVVVVPVLVCASQRIVMATVLCVGI